MENTNQEECKQCKRKLSNQQIGLVVFSSYFLIAAIYGTIKFIELIF